MHIFTYSTIPPLTNLNRSISKFATKNFVYRYLYCYSFSVRASTFISFLFVKKKKKKYFMKIYSQRVCQFTLVSTSCIITFFKRTRTGKNILFLVPQREIRERASAPKRRARLRFTRRREKRCPLVCSALKGMYWELKMPSPWDIVRYAPILVVSLHTKESHRLGDGRYF